MKKMEYKAPEMEVIELMTKANVLLSGSGEHPGFDDTPGDGGDAA